MEPIPVTEEAIAKGWLLKIMEPHLLRLFIGLPTAKDIGLLCLRCFKMDPMSLLFMNCDARLLVLDRMVVRLICILRS